MHVGIVSVNLGNKFYNHQLTNSEKILNSKSRSKRNAWECELTSGKIFRESILCRGTFPNIVTAITRIQLPEKASSCFNECHIEYHLWFEYIITERRENINVIASFKKKIVIFLCP